MSYLNISQNVCVCDMKTIAIATNASHYDLVEWNSPLWAWDGHTVWLYSLSSHLIIYTEGDRICSEFSKPQMNHKSQHETRILWHQCLCVFSLFCFEIKFTGASCKRGISFASWLQMRENRLGTLLHCWKVEQLSKILWPSTLILTNSSLNQGHVCLEIWCWCRVWTTILQSRIFSTLPCRIKHNHFKCMILR